MDDMFAPKVEKRGINAGLIIGALIGLMLVGGAIWWLSRTPTVVDQTAKILQGALREGSPEFANIAKGILISRDDDHTVESPTGRGTISMYIRGNILNRTGKTITALEVNVSVINQQNQSIRDKAVLVVPVQQ